MPPEQPTAEAIVSRGFLPENLPPVFTSAKLWPFYQPSQSAYLITNGCVGSISTYNASKRGHQRRLFGLPHPTFVHDQAAFIEKHWQQIERRIDRSPGSLSKPIFSATAARSTRITPHSELPTARLKAFSRFKFCLVTDVSRCFPSIYTHSIPWAINGRTAAKSDFRYASANVYGNRLDFVFRQAQDRQTIGVPVGPDTSRLVSEIILSAVDHSFLLKSGSKKPHYLRHVDDYWVGGHSFEECEKHLGNLRSSLREYELDVNELKTRIVSTNRVFGESWPIEFESRISQAFTPGSGIDKVSTLSQIIERATTENDDGMIRHVIRKMDEKHYWHSNWEILEHFLAQCAVQFSHSFDYVARVVAWRLRINAALDKPLWRDVSDSVISRASELGRDSESLWALWLMKEMSTKVSRKTSDNVIRNNSPLVLGFLAHMHAKNLTSDPNCAAKLRSKVDGNAYAGSTWPLSLELTHLGLQENILDGSTAEVPLKLLHENRASLIDWDAVPKVFVTDDDNGPAGPNLPLNAIEDFSSDYDSDEKEEEEDEEEDEIDFGEL